MTDYSKLKVMLEPTRTNNKVTELKELLTARSLPVSGKKEDLVARLSDYDASNVSGADDLGDLAPPEEDYDWDTPATKAAPAPAPETAAPPAPTAEKSTAPTTVPDTTDALALELEKRKKRAERFGIPVSDAVKVVERAQRFGLTKPVTDDSKKVARGKKFGNQTWKTDEKETSKPPPPVKKPTEPVKKILDDPVEAEKAKKRAERFGGGGEAKKVKT
jgi:SAP domain-containing ribonucleoprotein